MRWLRCRQGSAAGFYATVRLLPIAAPVSLGIAESGSRRRRGLLSAGAGAWVRLWRVPAFLCALTLPWRRRRRIGGEERGGTGGNLDGSDGCWRRRWRLRGWGYRPAVHDLAIRGMAGLHAGTDVRALRAAWTTEGGPSDSIRLRLPIMANSLSLAGGFVLDVIFVGPAPNARRSSRRSLTTLSVRRLNFSIGCSINAPYSWQCFERQQETPAFAEPRQDRGRNGPHVGCKPALFHCRSRLDTRHSRKAV